MNESLHYFCKTKNLDLALPTIQKHTIQDGNKLTVVLQTDTLIRQLHIDMDGTLGNFSDNFFDLLPGSIKIVSVTLEDGLNMDEQSATNRLKLMSIIDTYNTKSTK